MGFGSSGNGLRERPVSGVFLWEDPWDGHLQVCDSGWSLPHPLGNSGAERGWAVPRWAK